MDDGKLISGVISRNFSNTSTSTELVKITKDFFELTVAIPGTDAFKVSFVLPGTTPFIRIAT